jgi:ParB family chromosome partitioning protein
VLQPLIVTKIEEEVERGTTVQYELIAGERRLMASKLAGMRTVPAIIRRAPTEEREKLEMAIIENVQRENLNPIEEARGYARLQDEFKFTQREIAARVGKSREAIANAVRLLNLPSEIQEAVSAGKVNESQARLLLSIGDIPRQRELFAELIRDNLSVRELKARVQGTKPHSLPPARTVAPDPEFAELKEKLEEFLGTEVDLSRSGPSGHITINFYSPEELYGILGKILKENNSSSRESGIQSL